MPNGTGNDYSLKVTATDNQSNVTVKTITFTVSTNVSVNNIDASDVWWSPRKRCESRIPFLPMDLANRIHAWLSIAWHPGKPAATQKTGRARAGRGDFVILTSDEA
jgi:hypothetical protein